MTTLLLAALLLGPPGPAVAGAEAAAQGTEAERLRTAKALFFDRKYVEARQAWAAVLARSSGAQADAAAYWIARSSESLGEHARAFREYEAFLARRPADRTLAEEARTNRAGLAARLLKEGQHQYRAPLVEALSDPSRSVRYFAALQLAGVGGVECGAAAPVLRGIVSDEKDDDLLHRARLALLRCGESGSAGATAGAAGTSTRWLKVRIFEKARPGRPKISLNIPVALADVLFKSLPEDAAKELRKKGYDADNFWERLRRMPPAEILEIVGDEGEKIQIWIE